MELARQFFDEDDFGSGSVDSSTSSISQINFADVEDTSDRYTFSPVQAQNLVLISCERPRQRTTGQPSCRIGKYYWWAELFKPQKGIQRSAFVYEGYHENIYHDYLSTLFNISNFLDTAEQEVRVRGNYPLKIARKVLFSQSVTLNMADLPRWKPKAIIGKKTAEVENA
jgi:hypothetical protein